MTLPSATTRVSTQAGSAPVATDLIAVFAPVTTLDDGVPRFYANLSDLVDAHGYSEAAEYVGLHMDGTGQGALLVPLPIATAGIIRRSESVHTGTCSVTVTAGSDGALLPVDAILKVVTGGTVGTDQIRLSLSLDGGTSYKPVRLGTATTYVVPSIGVYFSFVSGGTLVAGDTILEFETSGPVFDSTGVTLGKTEMIAQALGVRTWLFVGDVPSLALGQAIETAVNAYDTAADRYVRAKFNVRDRRVLESSRVRAGMSGTPNITFAEVGATGDTITRATGSFVSDGFAVGDYVRVTGSALANNVSGKVTGVTATVLTLDTADLVNEGPVSGIAITAEPLYTFAATTITRNRGSWTDEGFAVGDTVTVAGSTSNDGTAIITTLSATVLTAAAESWTTEIGASCGVAVTLTETKAAHVAAMDAMFSAISTSSKVDIGFGRLTHLTPVTGYTMRLPVSWADSVRNYAHDLKVATWQKDLGALGWGIDGEHDERVTGGALAARFTCARTWGNGPAGAFIAQSLTRAADGSILAYSHNIDVVNLARTVVQRTTENFVGQTLILKAADALGRRFATAASLADLQAKVNAELQTNLLSNIGGEGQRASSAVWTAATDDDMGIADATLNGTLDLGLNGTIVHVATVVEVS